jgi:hypothetical protein
MHMHAFKNLLMDRIRQSHQEALIDLGLFGFYDSCLPKDLRLEQYISILQSTITEIEVAKMALLRNLSLSRGKENTSHGVLCRPCADPEENREVLPAILRC